MKKLAFILATILIFCCLGCAQTGIAFAASETTYTGVLEDLQKDDTFDVALYPSKSTLSEDDKVLDVFQIAESDAGELFLYVYQPLSGNLTASEARISTSIGDNLAPKDYTLTLLDRDGTLAKYLVNELQVKSDVVRHYFIVQLARPWDKQLDNGNVASTVAYSIEKLFTVETTDNGVAYTEKHDDCIEIVSKYVGNLRYYDGGTWGQDYYTSSHYVAFSTEISIDTIYAVDLVYYIKDYVLVSNMEYLHWDEYRDKGIYNITPTKKEVTLKSKQYASNNYRWSILAHSWETIQSVNQFINTEALEKSVKEKLQDKQWVLRFATTKIIRGSMPMGLATYDFSEVSDVTILRLNFLSNGRVYNLGVVDNKQTGNSVTEPDNDPSQVTIDQLQELLDELEKVFKWISENWWVIPVGLAVIGLIVWLIIAIVKKGAAVVFKAIGFVLWWVLKIIFYIVTLPVWLIIWGIRAIKKKKEQ